MNPHRISVKFFIEDPASVDLDAVIPVFHRWIQRQLTENLLIDVADYKHVPDGPGIMLIGHQGDFALDMAEGRPGVLYVGKREWPGGFRDNLRTVLRLGLTACRLVEDEPSLHIKVRTGEALLTMWDRLEAPNTDEAYEAARPDVGAALGELYEGAHLKLGRAYDDPRKCLAFAIEAPGAPDAATLLARAEAAEPSVPER